MKKGIASVWAVIITVIILLIIGVVGWYFLNKSQVAERNGLNSQITDLSNQVKDLQSKAATTGATATTPTSSTTATTDPYLYTNTKYGFSLEFNTLWKGYTLFETKVEGETATLYVYVPSTDPSWSKSTAAQPSIGSIAAIGVYSKAEWNDYLAQVAAGAPEESTKMGETSQYVFAYSHAQDYPTDLVKTANDLKNVAATFKAL